MKARRQYALDCLKRYWPQGATPIASLPIPTVSWPSTEPLPPEMAVIQLPAWAASYGVNGCLIAPRWSLATGDSAPWMRTDWVSVIFWYITGWAERAHEHLYGPIHSYSYRLRGWDGRLWDHAWVNRIALFLRAWASRVNAIPAAELLGPLPKAEVEITHDVDAVRKTGIIRLKQAAFHFFNALRLFIGGTTEEGLKKLQDGFHFLFSRDDYWCFDRIMSLETQAGTRSCFNFFAGTPPGHRTLSESLLDPSYDVLAPKMKKQINVLSAGGWTIGLHPSFAAWKDAKRISEEKARLERALNDVVSTCRQHWLRFSWEDTWRAQQHAGIKTDTTLGFNDRPGLRSGAALRFHPWNFFEEKPMEIEALPMLLMDSHLYDYKTLSPAARLAQVDRWIDEIQFVGGQVSIVWHQRVMSRDYGWEDGFRYLLDKLP